MVSLGTQQDEQARTSEPTVAGASHRDAQGSAAGRGVGGPGAGSTAEKAAALQGQEAASWAARLAPAASTGARTECDHARGDGDAGERDGWQEELAARVGEGRAAAQAPVWGEPCAQKLPAQETTSCPKEAPTTPCRQGAQASTTRPGASSAPSRATGAPTGQTRHSVGTPTRAAGASTGQTRQTAGRWTSQSSDPSGTHHRHCPKARRNARGHRPVQQRSADLSWPPVDVRPSAGSWPARSLRTEICPCSRERHAAWRRASPSALPRASPAPPTSPCARKFITRELMSHLRERAHEKTYP